MVLGSEILGGREVAIEYQLLLCLCVLLLVVLRACRHLDWMQVVCELEYWLESKLFWRSVDLR